MTVRAARLVRGWTAAFAATAVAAVSHVLGGGSTPEPAIVLFSLAMSGLVSCLLAGRSISLLRLTMAVGFSQGLFHLLFSFGSGPATIGSNAGHAGHTAFFRAVAEVSQYPQHRKTVGEGTIVLFRVHHLAALENIWLLASG